MVAVLKLVCFQIKIVVNATGLNWFSFDHNKTYFKLVLCHTRVCATIDDIINMSVMKILYCKFTFWTKFHPQTHWGVFHRQHQNVEGHVDV